MTISDVSRLFKISWDEVKYIDQKYLTKKYRKPPWKKLRKIGVDEIALKKGHKYLTVVVNLDTGQIVYVGKDRKKESLENFFYQIGTTRCSRIKAIVMDMWSPYISVAKDHLPNAKIVLDKFHIIAGYHRVIDEIRRSELAVASKEDRTVSKVPDIFYLKIGAN